MAKDNMNTGIALGEGEMQEDYWKNCPLMGQAKLEEFAKEFAPVYANSWWSSAVTGECPDFISARGSMLIPENNFFSSISAKVSK